MLTGMYHHTWLLPGSLPALTATIDRLTGHARLVDASPRTWVR